MFDMFGSNKRGWLIKLIEAVEEDAIDVIVEDEDGIAVEAICSVEAICGSDTMKKQVRFTEMFSQIFESSIELWEMNDAWKRKEARKRKRKNRERELRISEKRNWIVIYLNELKYNTSPLYINEFSRIK